jgi:LPS export ABC transporter protein LptC
MSFFRIRALGLDAFVSVLMGCLLLAVLLLGLKPKSLHATVQSPETPQTYMTGIHATRFNTLGDISEVISIDAVEYLELLNETRLHNPRVVRYEQQAPSWMAQADHGTGLLKTKTLSIESIRLNDNVILEHYSMKSPKSPLRLYTNELELTRSSAKTSDAVLIQGPGVNQIRSHGLIANFETGEITLLNRVNSIYDKTQI